MRYHKDFLKLVGSGSVKISRKGSGSGSVRFSRIRATLITMHSRVILESRKWKVCTKRLTHKIWGPKMTKHLISLVSPQFAPEYEQLNCNSIRVCPKSPKTQFLIYLIYKIQIIGAYRKNILENKYELMIHKN